MPQDPDRHEDKPAPRVRLSMLASMGVELAGVVAVFCLGGWWLDRKLGLEGPWFLLTGGFIGITGGLYKLWRVSRRFYE